MTGRIPSDKFAHPNNLLLSHKLFKDLQRCTDLVDTDLVENFDLIDNLKKLQRPICGSLALQKLDLVENFDLLENFAVTNFSSKSVIHCNSFTFIRDNQDNNSFQNSPTVRNAKLSL